MLFYPLVDYDIVVERFTILGKLSISMAIFNSYVTNYIEVFMINVATPGRKTSVDGIETIMNHHQLVISHKNSFTFASI